MNRKWYIAGFASLIFVLVGSAIIGAFPSANTKGSTWEKVTTIMFDTKSNTAAYNVEAAGWDVRVIEWIPDENDNIRCMFIAGTEKAGSACYEISKKVIK